MEHVNGNTKAIVAKSPQALVVEQAVRQAEQDFARLLPAFMQAQRERFMQLAVEAASKPEIVGCTPGSIVSGVMKAAQCGLPLDGTHAALTPYRVNGVPTAQFIPMFQGLIVAAMRNGKVKKVWSAVVYEGDEFRETLGTRPELVHVPSRGNRSIEKAHGVYACAMLDNGEVVHEFMDREQVLAIKARSKAQKGPWSNPKDEPEMWRKTAVRRLSKYLPKSPDLQAVLDADEEFEPLEPREPEYQDVTPPASAAGPKRTLADLARQGAAAEAHEEQPADDSPPPESHWFAGVEILGGIPRSELEAPIGGKGPLAALTFAQAAEATDEKVQAEVRRILAEGAQIQADRGQTPRAYQKLAEACRLAAQPVHAGEEGFQ